MFRLDRGPARLFLVDGPWGRLPPPRRGVWMWWLWWACVALMALIWLNDRPLTAKCHNLLNG